MQADDPWLNPAVHKSISSIFSCRLFGSFAFYWVLQQRYGFPLWSVKSVRKKYVLWGYWELSVNFCSCGREGGFFFFFGNLLYCQAILKNKTSIIQMKLVLHSSRCLWCCLSTFTALQNRRKQMPFGSKFSCQLNVTHKIPCRYFLIFFLFFFSDIWTTEKVVLLIYLFLVEGCTWNYLQ